MDGEITATDVLFVAFSIAKIKGVDVTMCHSFEDLWSAYLEQLPTEEVQCLSRHVSGSMLRKGIEARLND